MDLPSGDLCHDPKTNADLVCFLSRKNHNRLILHELEGGIAVVRISQNAVVKYGVGINEDEARNQEAAFKLIDQSIIRVPRVFRFFSSEDSGYIIMEYIEGPTLESLIKDNKHSGAYVEKMVKALDHFTEIRHNMPGPLSGGFAQGFLWIPHDSIRPNTVSKIEQYYNIRQLRKSSGKLKIQQYPLVLCHLDIAPRNIIVHNGSLCLIDWAAAGFYPSLFERCTLRINAGKPSDWNNMLLQNLSNLDEEEDFQAQLLERAYYLSQKFI